jgi:EAL domain-containing protein (putative c-di-GMP-specific phosphodiesterase class I)
LKDIGVMLALDDFGTGYSSLSYLSRFPVDVVKIDRTFVADLLHHEANRAIVRKVIELAHLLHLVVVAEGVETIDELHEVAALKGDFCQGFYFSPPMSTTSLVRLTTQVSTESSLRLPITTG